MNGRSLMVLEDMNLARKRRLAAAGWKETSVKELLDLSEADMRYIETKLALSRRLREFRQQRHLTQTRAAVVLAEAAEDIAQASGQGSRLRSR